MKIFPILTEAWGLYRRHFWLIIALVATVWVPCELFSSYMDYNVFDPDSFRASFKLSRFLDNFIGIIALSAVICYASGALEGTPPSYGDSMRVGTRCWGRMWITRFLGGICLLISLLLLVLPVIYVGVRLCFAEIVVVREGISGTAAIKRSFALTKGLFWPLLGLSAAAALVPILGTIALVLPAVFFESLDVWWVDALGSLGIDFLVAYMTLVYVCAFPVVERLTVPPELPVPAQ